MRRSPRVSLLCFDPRRPDRFLEFEGLVVVMTEDGALEHLDLSASKYAGHPVRYFGDVVPIAFADAEVPVLCQVEPITVVASGASIGPARSRSRPPTSTF